MLVKTNKTNYILHREAIAADFDVGGVCFEVKDLRKPEELFVAQSLTTEDYGILSTYVERKGQTYYLYYLGEKGSTRFATFRQKLQSLRYSSLKAASVHVNTKRFEDDYVLIQLLLGYLGSKDRKGMKIPYGNYLGNLYANKIPFTQKSNKVIAGLEIHGDTIAFLRVHYTKNKTVYLNVETWMPFTKNLLIEQKRMKKYKFVMEIDPFWRFMIQVPWGTVKERLEVWAKKPADTSIFKGWYVRGTYLPGNKNSVAFYTMSPGKQLEDKLKNYVEFIQKVNKELEKYMALTPCEEEFEQYSIVGNKELKRREQQLKEEIISSVLSKGITVCPLSNQVDYAEKAKLLADTLVSYLGVPEKKVQQAKKPNPNTWNIQIVDDKSLFVDNKGNHNIFTDNYRSEEGVCLQHIVAETITDKKAFFAVLDVALTELLIKDAMLHHRVPNSMVPNRNISVAISRQMDQETVTREDNRPIKEYFALTIGNDGAIKETVYLTGNEYPKTSLSEEVFYKFAILENSDEMRTLRVPEGLIRFDQGDFCGIYRTTGRPLPDYAKFLADYEAKKKQGKLDAAEILRMMDEYASINPKNAAHIEKALSLAKEDVYSFADENDKISVSAWYTLLQESGISHTNSFYEDMEKQYPGKIIFQIHNKREHDNPYEIDKMTGICYRDNEDSIEYYVGLRKVSAAGKAKTIRGGLPIRMVENDGSFTFDEFAGLLDVLWVRRGTMTPTVLPYPFKILKEYIKAEDNKKRMNKIAAGIAEQSVLSSAEKS